MGVDVISPPAHAAFSTPTELLEFVAKLRALSEGKPVGFKLCIGRRDQFLGICKAMLKTGITPDFITVDGGEGGTGAAPTEMTNSVGTPLKDALVFVVSPGQGDCIGRGLRQLRPRHDDGARVYSGSQLQYRSLPYGYSDDKPCTCKGAGGF